MVHRCSKNKLLFWVNEWRMNWDEPCFYKKSTLPQKGWLTRAQLNTALDLPKHTFSFTEHLTQSLTNYTTNVFPINSDISRSWTYFSALDCQKLWGSGLNRIQFYSYNKYVTFLRYCLMWRIVTFLYLT